MRAGARRALVRGASARPACAPWWSSESTSYVPSFEAEASLTVVRL